MITRGFGPLAKRIITRGYGLLIRKIKTGGKHFEEQATLYRKVILEDKEMLEVIIQSFSAGIFDD